MILVDTSVWVDHLGRGDPIMAALLDADQVVMHPFVSGEIALGHLNPREEILAELDAFLTVPVADPDEVAAVIERHALFGTGIGYVDAHLLASMLLAPGARLWTRDKRLHAAAERLGVAAKPVN